MVLSTRKLSAVKSRNYLKKAEELYLEALEAQRSGRFNFAIISAAKDNLPAGAFNIRSGGETRIIDLAKNILALSSSTSKIVFLPFPHGDHRRRLPDVTRVKESVKWGSHSNFGEGLKRTFEWFRSESSS